LGGKGFVYIQKKLFFIATSDDWPSTNEKDIQIIEYDNSYSRSSFQMMWKRIALMTDKDVHMRD